MTSRKSIFVLTNPRSTLNYVSCNTIDQCNLKKTKHAQSWLVQIAIGTKRKVTKTINQCFIKIYQMNALVNENMLPLGSYDFMIGMDWIEQHRAKVDFFNKSLTCLNEQGIKPKIQGIQEGIKVRQISIMKLKKSASKSYQLCYNLVFSWLWEKNDQHNHITTIKLKTSLFNFREGSLFTTQTRLSGCLIRHNG